MRKRDPSLPDEPAVQWRGPSKSQKKREARAVADIGSILVRLRKSDLEKLPLDDDLKQAIVSCQNMKKGAYARQLRYIGKQLNAMDVEPLLAAMRALSIPVGD